MKLTLDGTPKEMRDFLDEPTEYQMVIDDLAGDIIGLQRTTQQLEGGIKILLGGKDDKKGNKQTR